MNESKWHNRIMHLTSFSLGIVVTALMISQGWFNEFLYVLGGSIFILFISLVYGYVRGIDYMTTNHPDYDGEDMYGGDETQK
jgi:hypothetical protein